MPSLSAVGISGLQAGEDVNLLLSGTNLGYKLVSIGPLLTPGSTIIYPFSYFIAAIVTEVYGYKVTRNLIWYAVICGYIYALVIAIIIDMPSPAFWEKKEAYEAVFGDLLRFTTGGSIGMVISEFLNCYVISKWKILTKGKYFALRAFGSTSIGEAAHVIIRVLSKLSLTCHTTPAAINREVFLNEMGGSGNINRRIISTFNGSEKSHI